LTKFKYQGCKTNYNKTKQHNMSKKITKGKLKYLAK
jgi:hypothetical protein